MDSPAHGHYCTPASMHTGTHVHRHPHTWTQTPTHSSTHTKRPQQTQTLTCRGTQAHGRPCTRVIAHCHSRTQTPVCTDTPAHSAHPQQHSLPHVPMPTDTRCGSQCHPPHAALPSPSTAQNWVALRTPFTGPTARAMGEHQVTTWG